jgi:hypothetical protein
MDKVELINSNMARLFSIASYNVLADSYVNARWYPNVDPEVLQGEMRKFALAERVTSLNADVFHTAGLRAEPAKLMEIDDLTPLPSAGEPSDHLALVAAFEKG